MTNATVRIYNGKKELGDMGIICSEEYAIYGYNKYNKTEDYEILDQIKVMFPTVTSFDLISGLSDIRTIHDV